MPVHVRITNEQLKLLRADVGSRSTGFSPDALEQIVEANEDVDDIWTRSAALFKPWRHFTNEEYRHSSQRLIDLRRDIISLVSSDQRDGHEAREKIGQALHTIQDFYSHSNWVGNPPEK